MAIFQGLLFLFFGCGLLLMDYQALSGGYLPCGSGVKGRLLVGKRQQPALFWFMFIAYGTAGIWLVIYSLRLLTGNVDPLPLS